MCPLFGILLETYPQVSESFILNEILELERQGLNLHIFSLRHLSEQSPHPSAALINAPVTYLPSLLPKFDYIQERKLIEAQVSLFQQDSNIYLETLKLYLKRDDDQQLHEFLQGGYLARQVQMLGITHLHAYSVNVPTATVEIAQALSGVSYSITTHTQDTYYNDYAALDRRIAKAELVFTRTDYDRRYLESILTAGTPVHIGYYGIDTARFTPVSKKQQSVFPLILSINHFHKNSGCHYLLKACYRLKQRGLSFHCVIVGDGPLEASIQQQISRFGLSKQITLVSDPAQEQLMDYYRQADLFVLPCLANDGRRNGIPCVLLEAMAMEIPVVSTNILGISELVQSYSNGILVPERDALSLAQALEAMLCQPHLKTTFGKAGRFTVLDKFGLASNVENMKILLLNVLRQFTICSSQAGVLRDLYKISAV